MNAGEPKAQLWVIDDDPMLVDLVCLWFGEFGFEVQAFTAPSDVLAEVGRSGIPDVSACLLIDYVMPQMNGIALAKAMRDQGFWGACILMSAGIDVAAAVEAMRGEFFHVIEKPLQPQTLLAEVQRAIARARELGSRRLRHAIVMSRALRLTQRERDVLAALCTGKMNKQVADELGLSIKTIETHRTRLAEKLQLRNAAELIRFGIELFEADTGDLRRSSNSSY